MNFNALKCKIGLHDWAYTAATYRNFNHQRLAMPDTEAERVCSRCDKHQHRVEHCLGLNPLKYVYTWYVK